MKTTLDQAPGAPGAPALWAPSAKTGVGTALSPVSDVWFTLCQGILTEVYHPSVDVACTRDMGMVVTDRQEFLSEEKRDTRSQVSYLSDGVPAFRVVNTCKRGRYRLEKLMLTDPCRPTVLQNVRFIPLQGTMTDYSVFVMLNPHVGNQGGGNTAWVGEYKGVSLLFAGRNDMTLALACSVPWRKRSVGFVGNSDGWRDVLQHKQMDWSYERAEHGNVALTGEVDLETSNGEFLLALSFGRNEGEAGHRARASLLQGFEAASKVYVRAWAEWQNELLPLAKSKQHTQNLYHISAAVMRTHEDKHFPGSIIASLATPWGFAQGDGNLGYHRVWPRDMIQTVGGMMAIQKHEDARRVLTYFRVTQDADGHWPQNMFANGLHSWDGIQLDETAFVILLVDLTLREHALDEDSLASFWPMVRQAAGYLVRHGPVTPLDRWEEEAGYFASTMAVEIPALLAAADLAEHYGERDLTSYLRETADAWNAVIERLLYVTGTDLARRAGVEGYYVRFARPDQLEASTPAAGEVTLKNHLPGQGRHPVAEIVSPDALSLVRFGLRAATDPRIVNTVRVIDMLLKVDTPRGPCWHRYNDDGYGEHADGAPFDGTGIGRVWPLLTGERAHYELAAGRPDEAEKLMRVMEGFANDSGLIPEQIWDSPDIPEQELYCGRPSGSAMPLVWAHAEYLKLRRSLHDGRVFDMPLQTVQRYLVEKADFPRVFWRIDQKCRSLAWGQVLRLEVLAKAVVHWSTDNWHTVQYRPTRETGIGVHLIDLATENLAAGAEIVFTFYWPETGQWEGRNYCVTVDKYQANKEKRTSSQTHQAARTYKDAIEDYSQRGERNVHEIGASPSRRQHEHAQESHGKRRARHDEN